ncbi:hypothetical protein BDV37DRAFT_258772 [Aspergillus pseudonomiae]|uniref:Uncharacterized protein n=1 Tax=Aspergillus pseudonomiae TaxID=1506151 RepID=A0A5N7D2H6_9EURO|nr:uncharacterized protein BDV37DRAFT_258772 [Aspergillus pseudonomiae]KAE8400048.1 hypothetical protein BDV37DRAFT_258772 [Aspergillus pseudonomiae]
MMAQRLFVDFFFPFICFLYILFPPLFRCLFYDIYKCFLGGSLFFSTQEVNIDQDDASNEPNVSPGPMSSDPIP